MGFVVQKSLVCDRCGASVPVRDDKVLSSEFGQMFPGWLQVDGNRALCPDCAPGYELLKARHKVETEDYIAGA